MGGDDTLVGRGGNRMDEGLNKDNMFKAGGNDTIIGGAGQDLLAVMEDGTLSTHTTVEVRTLSNVERVGNTLPVH